MTFIRYKTIVIALVGIFILVFIGLFCLPVYSFLSPNIPTTSADILVVEGWLGEEGLEKAKEEFLKKDYNLLITTGFPYNDGFRMGSGGIAKFNLQNHVKPAIDSLYTIILTIRGTKVKNIFAHVMLYADTTELGDCYSTRPKKEHTFIVKLNLPPEFITLEFDNDTYTRYQDRELYLYSIKVNEYVLPANSPQVALYDDDRNGLDSLIRFLSQSSATDAANYLVNIGIPDSLVVSVETEDKGISKTYASAIDVRRRYIDSGIFGKRSIMIFSEGVHARRSYISFKKVFGSFAQVGVISLSDKNITKFNWWKSFKGWSTVLYEIAGLVYVDFFC
jgi:hypothetical protein